MKIDSKFTFDDRVKDMCSKANNECYTSGSVTPSMSLERKRTLVNSAPSLPYYTNFKRYFI